MISKMGLLVTAFFIFGPSGALAANICDSNLGGQWSCVISGQPARALNIETRFENEKSTKVMGYVINKTEIVVANGQYQTKEGPGEKDSDLPYAQESRYICDDGALVNSTITYSFPTKDDYFKHHIVIGPSIMKTVYKVQSDGTMTVTHTSPTTAVQELCKRI